LPERQEGIRVVRARRWVRTTAGAAALSAVLLAGCGGGGESADSPSTNPLDPPSTQPTAPPTTTIPPLDVLPGMPPVVNRNNLYSETTSDKIADIAKDDLPRVYVPNRAANEVAVIDPATMQVVDRYRVGINPQHVVPSWDLHTLWVTNNAEGRTDGSLTPIDPQSGKPGQSIPVDDPYNMYFTPDGKSAIVVAEAFKRLDFRDPNTMALQSQISTPDCAGINHADFSIDGKYVIFTCEFQGSLVKIDLATKQVAGYLRLSGGGMPQDIRVSPDGKTFYVAEMMRGGVYTIDPVAFAETGFIETGVGTHGLYPSRDAKVLYVANRGSSRVGGPPNGPGSVSVLDWLNNNQIAANWPVPGGGSPDMGGVSADGKTLWLSGRYDNEVYAINTATGEYTIIPVGSEPHGLAVWPQPGRYSLGHTGNMR
jgi:YVTN family beta-propeller protein